MTTNWKSDDKKSANQKPNTQPAKDADPKIISGTMLSSWSRQQKLAMIACFLILGVLVVVSACSKESSKPALVGVSSPAANSAAPDITQNAATSPAAMAAAAPVKKSARKRPANVTFTDTNAGVSFLYPRKFSVISGDKAQVQLAAVGDVPMNFAESGGSTIATVVLPADSYPRTDFESAFFTVNINRSVSEQECGHFAFVDTRNADGEPVDAEKVKIGAADMETTSSFAASADAQAEAQYYHSYENGACYEYVLGLGTEGSATEDGVEHVDRDQVFARLEKILATVRIDSATIDPAKVNDAKIDEAKIDPATPKPVPESEATGMNGGKE
jgi:hypothetical protein